jgi:hypothetical protein
MEWEAKTEDVIHICNLMESIENVKENPQSLFIRCPDIVQKLGRIEQQKVPQTIRFINSMNLRSQSEDSTCSFEELKLLLQKFVEFTDFKTIQFYK